MKKYLSILLLLVAAVLVSCGDNEITDCYELRYEPKHNSMTGLMEPNLDISKLHFREAGIGEEEFIALKEQEFSEDLARVAASGSDSLFNSMAEYGLTREQFDDFAEEMKSEAANWKRWLIFVTHPSKEDADKMMEYFKRSYKEIIQKGEYEDGHFKVRVVPIKGR